ncbi:MAG: hypothetical protein RLZZ301_963 [Bacteroidota bacterium]|jgi:hypothetical protein
MDQLLKEISQKKNAFVSKHTGDELLLIPLQNNVADFNQYLVLNEVAAFIWEQLENRSEAKVIKKALYENFEAPQETINADFDHFIQELHRFTCAS